MYRGRQQPDRPERLVMPGRAAVAAAMQAERHEPRSELPDQLLSGGGVASLLEEAGDHMVIPELLQGPEAGPRVEAQVVLKAAAGGGEVMASVLHRPGA